MNAHRIPARDQLGPDPEPLPPRFDVLLAMHIEERRRPSPRPPVRIDARRPASERAASERAVAA